MWFFHVHPLKLFKMVKMCEKFSFMPQETPFYPPLCLPGERAKYEVVIIIMEAYPLATNVVICVFSSIKWPISIENWKNWLFSYIFYCFLLFCIGNTCQNTFAFIPTWSPAFQILKLVMELSNHVPSKPWKSPEGGICSTLNTFSRVAMGDRASDRNYVQGM